MKLSELRKIVESVSVKCADYADPEVVFQGNESGGEDEDGEATYTTCLGGVYSVWLREASVNSPAQLVIDCVITESEL